MGDTEKRGADVILVYPKTGMDLGSTVAPPHAVLAVAAPLHKAGYKIKIIDQRTDPHWKDTLTRELESKPICVGISTMTGTQIHFALEAAKVVRSLTNGSIPLVWGGPHPTLLPEQTLESEFVDIVCVGEADITFPELVRALQAKSKLASIEGIAYKDGGQVVVTPSRPLINVEKLLPVPWELINVNDYIHPDMYLKESPRTLDIGQTSRGCPFKCAFCSSASIRQRRWRAFSVERSLEAIIEPIRRFQLTGIWIRDDEFYVNRERANKICEGMVRENLNIHWYTSGTRVDLFNRATEEDIALLKRSGAYVLKFGAESGSDRVLQLMEKGITAQDTINANLKAKKHGIIPAFSLMAGFPTETFEEINQTIDLALRLQRDNPKVQFESIALYTALPGTPMWSLAVEMGLKPPEKLEGWSNWFFDEFDSEGIRLPWFNYADRKKLANLNYLCQLAFAFPNAMDSIRNSFVRWLLKGFTFPFISYFRLRFRHKSFSFAPELDVVRYLRRKIFFKSYFTIK